MHRGDICPETTRVGSTTKIKKKINKSRLDASTGTFSLYQRRQSAITDAKDHLAIMAVWKNSNKFTLHLCKDILLSKRLLYVSNFIITRTRLICIICSSGSAVSPQNTKRLYFQIKMTSSAVGGVEKRNKEINKTQRWFSVWRRWNNSVNDGFKWDYYGMVMKRERM